MRARPELGSDLERFTGAETIAEIALSLGRDGADAELFDAITGALDGLAGQTGAAAREATLAGAWRIVAALGFTPTLDECVECGRAIDREDSALFTHAGGGVLCKRCAALDTGGRKLPAAARAAIGAWMEGRHEAKLTDSAAKAHQRLLREFLCHHLHDGRSLSAFDMWERAGWSAA